MQLAGSVKTIPRHRDAIYTEAPTINAAILAARSGRIYYPLLGSPYTPLPYGPLFYFCNTILARFAHSNLLRTILFGRLLTFATYLLCVILIYQIGRSLRTPAWQAALSAALFLALPVYHYDVAVRPDMPALLLMLLSLYVVIRRESPGPLEYTLAGSLAGAAFLVKQSGVIGFLAIAAVLLSGRKYRQAAALALGAIAPVVLALVLLLALHEPFLPHLFILDKASWSFGDGIFWTLRLFRDPNLLIPVAIFCLGFPIASVCDQRTQMVVSFALLNFCAALVFVGQTLGDANYFFPAAAGSAMLLPFATELVEHSGKRFQALVCIAMIVWLPFAFAFEARSLWNAARVPSSPDLPLVSLQPLRILSDAPYFNLLGTSPEFLDPLLVHSLELAGAGDSASSLLLSTVRHAQYDLVIVAHGEPAVGAYRRIGFLSPAVADALNENYQRLCETFDQNPRPILVLVPNDRPDPVAPEILSQTFGAACEPEPGRAPQLTILPGAR